MSIRKETFDDAKLAIQFMENLAFSNTQHIFRGHTDSGYRLQTSLFRYYKTPVEMLAYSVDELINRFRVGLAKIGITPFDSNNRQDWLEFARHHGVPAPCLDFTYSPYIALFFAFNGARGISTIENRKEYVVVYVLNISALALSWASRKINPQANSEKWEQAYRKFLYPGNDLFKAGFPVELQFIPFPSKHNKRMQKQQGALLYDALDYSMIGFRDLEDYIGTIKEPIVRYPDGTEKSGEPTLTKVFINKICIRDALERLELMGITGGSLFLEPAGVAMDVMNSYYYISKTSYLRDITFPLPTDDVRM